ncbi:MAG: glucose-1-phosphate cytidylyltransferase [Rhodoglobus sp.]
MKAVILAGGLGTRLSEETSVRPKPMVEIGGMPILWHIMKLYAGHGIHEFVICCGYKGYVIKEFFANYALHTSDVTFDLRADTMEVHERRAEPWRITLVDTGDSSMTGGRIRRVADYLRDGEEFCLTYGDGVGDIDITASIDFHRSHGHDATMTVMRPAARFGAVVMDNAGQVTSFQEKPVGDGGQINGGFFVLSPRVLDRIDDDSTVWEEGPLKSLAADGELVAFEHEGFWQPMDTLRDKNNLEELWASNRAPWKLWS